MSEKAEAGHRTPRPGRISTERRVTIPVATLEAAGLAPGDTVEFVVTSPGRIEIRRHRSRFEGVIGTVPHLEDYVDIDALRDGDDVDLVTGDDGSVTIRRHRSRMDGVVGTAPGFSETFDPGAPRAERNRE